MRQNSPGTRRVPGKRENSISSSPIPPSTPIPRRSNDETRRDRFVRPAFRNIIIIAPRGRARVYIIILNALSRARPGAIIKNGAHRPLRFNVDNRWLGPGSRRYRGRGRRPPAVARRVRGNRRRGTATEVRCRSPRRARRNATRSGPVSLSRAPTITHYVFLAAPSEQPFSLPDGPVAFPSRLVR